MTKITLKILEIDNSIKQDITHFLMGLNNIY